MSIANRAGPVLVTRSEPGASALIDALSKAGYTAVRFPVLEIRPLDSPAIRTILAGLDRFDVALFVSGHAVRLGMPIIDGRWRERPPLLWIAVGRTTARALADYGIAAVAPRQETSEGILALPQLRDVGGSRILICAGRGGRSLLGETLTQRGAVVERCELYAREAVPIDAGTAATAIDGAVGAVVVSSVDGARAFATVWRRIGGDARVAVVAPSQRVADALAELGFHRVVVADGAGAQAIVAAVARLAGEESRGVTRNHDEQ